MVENISRHDVEEQLKGKGDYVRMDYLQRLLGKSLDLGTRKYVSTVLSKIYESRGMFLEAARLLRNVAEVNATVMTSKQDLMRSAELFIAGNNFDEAEISFRRAMGHANTSEKESLKKKLKSLYMFHAQACLDRDKRKQALLAYEKLMDLDLNEEERTEVKEKLMKLYEQLGKMREFFALKNS